jgi:hypothetical protein
MSGPAPAYGDPYGDDGDWDEDDPACEGSCEDEFCGVNCEIEANHAGAHLCDYHAWTRAGCPDPRGR